MKKIERKIQLTGGSSYSIILPKTWIQKHKLTQQSKVLITENQVGELIITPFQYQVKPKQVMVSITNPIAEKRDYLKDILTLVYRKGYHIIILKTNGNIDSLVPEITTSLIELPGLELVKQEGNSVIVQFVQHSRSPFSVKTEIETIILGLENLLQYYISLLKSKTIRIEQTIKQKQILNKAKINYALRVLHKELFVEKSSFIEIMNKNMQELRRVLFKLWDLIDFLKEMKSDKLVEEARHAVIVQLDETIVLLERFIQVLRTKDMSYNKEKILSTQSSKKHETVEVTEHLPLKNEGGMRVQGILAYLKKFKRELNTSISFLARSFPEEVIRI